MNRLKVFGVYTAQFPFLDTQASKIRPVVIVNKPQGTHNIVAIIPISSSTKREGIDVVLEYWEDEGLFKPSVARVHRLTTVLLSDIRTELGSLKQNDIQSLQEAMREFLNL